ncbi:MAG TPA: ATP-binding protein, partial [Thermomicrobiales bacterium]|nr:ATP-binding protein [Thermomicrobiales bacterium]
PQRFDARALTRDVHSSIASLMEARDQVLKLTVPADPVWIYADRGRLEQVLLNLLSNATKFSPDGASILLALRADAEGTTWSVTDNGRGIGPEDQVHLFERFFTREAGEVGRNPGAGLGLPIALAIAQAHGGTIVVDSAVGRGSTFTVAIPRRLTLEADEE